MKEFRVCFQCKQQFEVRVSPSRVGRGKYCSKRCVALNSDRLFQKGNKLNLGRKLSEKTKGKIALAHRGKPETKEAVEKATASRKKKGYAWVKTASYRLKMSQALKGRKVTWAVKGDTHPRWKDGRSNDLEYKKNYGQKYRQSHKEELRYLTHKYRLLKKEAGGSHTLEEWLKLKAIYHYMCLCCKRQEPEIKLTEDHIIPISKGGTDYIWNIQPLCKSCNSRKHDFEIDYREELYATP